MRIVAGKHRSRKIEAVEGMKTRPTLDKVKEAVFSSLGGTFYDGWILDLFSGSGNIALEAISRGMQHAVMVDMSFDAIATMKRNVALLKEEAACEVWKMDAKKALRQCGAKQYQFDFIYLDPPYIQKNIAELMELILEQNLLKDDGILIYEGLKEDENPTHPGLTLYKEASYGIVKIRYYRKEC